MLQRGFTIFEQIITVLIIGIIAGISLPSTQISAEKKNLTQYAHRITNWFKVLNLKSLNLNSDHQIIKQNNSLVEISTLSGISPDVRLIPDNLTVDFSTNQIRFFSTGTLSPSSVRIKSKNYLCIIRLALRGRIIRECN